MDFRNATSLFADKDFDGEPIRIKELSENDEIGEFDEEIDIENIKDEITGEKISFDNSEDENKDNNDKKKKKVFVDGVDVQIINERVQYIGLDGKLITENLINYSKRNILKKYQTLSVFLNEWNKTTQKEIIIKELESKGVFFENIKNIMGNNFDPFDLICHIAFDKKPLTRLERINNIKKRDYFTKYEKKARLVIEAILEKYSDGGILNYEDLSIINLDPINKVGTPVEIAEFFGGKESLFKVMNEISNQIYDTGKI